MAEKNNAKCSICGKDYHVCLSCKDSMALSPWKIHTDTAEHYKVYQIIRGYNTGVYSKDEAKLKLQKVDLSDLNTFREHIKSTIKKILKEDKAALKADVKEIVEDKKAEAKIELNAEAKTTIEVEAKNAKSTYKKSSKVEEK